MKVTEAKELLTETESKIAGLLAAFEEQTGLKVNEVFYLRRETSATNKTGLIGQKTTTVLSRSVTIKAHL